MEKTFYLQRGAAGWSDYSVYTKSELKEALEEGGLDEDEEVLELSVVRAYKITRPPACLVPTVPERKKRGRPIKN